MSEASFEVMNKKLDTIIKMQEDLLAILSGKTGVLDLVKKQEAEKQPKSNLPKEIAELGDIFVEWIVPHPNGFKMKSYCKDTDTWGDLNDGMQSAGYKWVSDGKNSHWQKA